MRPLYIFDLDGTLAITDHRVPILKDKLDPRRWTKYYEACSEDEPSHFVIGLMDHLAILDPDIWIFTGRSERVRGKTLKWLNQHTLSFKGESDSRKLIMRPLENNMPAVELKKWWIDGMLIGDRERITGIFEDDHKMVRIWKELQIMCYQIHNPGSVQNVQ